MTERAKPLGPKQKKPAPKPAAEIAEDDLDQATGGVTATVKKIPTPSGPIPIPYPKET